MPQKNHCSAPSEVTQQERAKSWAGGKDFPSIFFLMNAEVLPLPWKLLLRHSGSTSAALKRVGACFDFKPVE